MRTNLPWVVPEKVGRRIGRILQKYPSMAAHYEIVSEADASAKRIVRVAVKRRSESQTEQTLRGCYVIETSHQDRDAKTIWDLYTTLHRVENAFRCLKSDLGMRPVHHQLARRTEGHLFISVLAYHLLIATENTLRASGEKRSWKTIRETMSTLTRATIAFVDAENCTHHIRITGAPEPEHGKILARLNIESPFKRREQKFQSHL